MRAVAGRYQLTRALGQGGMGTVYLAEDPLAARLVAVKELRAPSGMPGAERETFMKRAMQEARSAARIQHPGVVTLYDVVPPSQDDDAMYLIMEYVDGGSFADEMQRGGPLTLRRATEVGLQLLSVLEAAHALGVIHRDIKPANILITRAGQAKLTDFGLAYMAGDTRLTGMGSVAGTVAYMAPELFETGTITPAADIWALGATLYHAADGRNPFDRGATGPTLRAILVDPLPDPGCGTLLATACSAMLQRDPARRATIAQARALMTGAPNPTAHSGPGYAAPQANTPLAPEPIAHHHCQEIPTQTVEVRQPTFLPHGTNAAR
jgi:eukaryotic-like serine/threonine-protein kinase